jgi:hypothetical protein
MLVKNNLLTGATLALVLAMVGSTNMSGAQEAAGPTPSASAVRHGAAYGGWGFDDSGVDPKSNPGDSFFDFASGRWDARTIPLRRVRRSL